MYSMYVSTQNTMMPDNTSGQFYVNLPMESLRREKKAVQDQDDSDGG